MADLIGDLEPLVPLGMVLPEGDALTKRCHGLVWSCQTLCGKN